MLEMQDNSLIKRITWIGIFINLGLSILKFIVGFLGESQAVIADAVHSLSDMATDFAIIFGVKFWSAPPDQGHPYGHRKIESLITVAIGLFLASVAVSLAYKALVNIRETHSLAPSWIAIIGPVFSIILKEILYRRTLAIGKRAKSSAVIANAWHHRSDVLSSIPAVIAVAVSAINPSWAFIDHIGALIITIFILKVSWDIIAPALSELTDRGASAKDLEKICQLARHVEGVLDVHAVRTRKFGSGISVDLHILVEPEMSVRQGHEISEQVETKLLQEGPDILDVVIHLEPFEVTS